MSDKFHEAMQHLRDFIPKIENQADDLSGEIHVAVIFFEEAREGIKLEIDDLKKECEVLTKVIGALNALDDKFNSDIIEEVLQEWEVEEDQGGPPKDSPQITEDKKEVN